MVRLYRVARCGTKRPRALVGSSRVVCWNGTDALEEHAMSVELSADVQEIVKRLVATGEFASESDVVNHAIAELDERLAEHAAVRSGIADMQAGRVRSHDEVMREIERDFPFVSPQS